jgi:hypothetical protein
MTMSTSTLEAGRICVAIAQIERRGRSDYGRVQGAGKGIYEQIRYFRAMIRVELK